MYYSLPDVAEDFRGKHLCTMETKHTLCLSSA